MKDSEVVSTVGTLLFILALVLGLFLIYYNHQKTKLLMDDLCASASGVKMSEFKYGLTQNIKFKCEGRGDMVFSSKFKKCELNEWDEYICKKKKPSKSVWKNLFR